MKNDNLIKSFKSIKWYEWIMAVVMIFIAGRAMFMAFGAGEVGGNPPWLTIVNFVSAVCGVFCIFFCAKASISNFAFGLINTVVYMIYLWYWKIYGTFCLEAIIYLPMNIISWVVWSKHRDSVQPELTKAKRLTIPQNIIVAIVIGAAAIIYHAILAKIGGSVPWLDAFTVSIGIIATGLEMLRYREQYVWWIVQDIISVSMYIVHFDPVYLTKKSIYLIMAIIGLINWFRLNKERNKENL